MEQTVQRNKDFPTFRDTFLKILRDGFYKENPDYPDLPDEVFFAAFKRVCLEAQERRKSDRCIKRREAKKNAERGFKNGLKRTTKTVSRKTIITVAKNNLISNK